MTTIAIDLKNKKLYTDSRATFQGNSIHLSLFGLTLFKWKRDDPFKDDGFCKTFESTSPDIILTGSGNVGCIENFIESYNKGTPKHYLLKRSAVSVIETTPYLKVTQHRKDGYYTTTDDEADFLIYGSGGNHCAGAYLGNGKDMEAAIRIAKDLDSGTGGDIIEVDLSGRAFNEDVY